MSAIVVSYVMLWILVVGLAIVTLGLLRQVGLLHLRIGPRGGLETTDGPEIGAAVATRHVVTLDGGRLSLPVTGKKTVLLFVSPTCSVCHDLVPAMRSYARHMPTDVGLAIVSLGDANASEVFARQLDGAGVPVVADPALSGDLGVSTAPYMLKVEDGRLVAKGVVNTLEQLEALADASWTESELPVVDQIGDQGPSAPASSHA